MSRVNAEDDGSKTFRALTQWRDSLVNLTARNRLLNYRATRASTLEFTRHSPAEIYAVVDSRALTYTMGTRPPAPPVAATDDASSDESQGLEQAALDQLLEFDFDEHPDVLFADKTQREVDRALRNLAATAKREYLDKGLHTVYLGFGELRWKEDSGDARRSPLILLPVDLNALGPREHMYIEFSEEDLAVNPALAIRTSTDLGIDLPTSEEVLAALDADGMPAALDLFRRVTWPEDWEVRDFAVLGSFMFAKEAMYRDLLNNGEAIGNSPLVRALSGGVSAGSSSFSFEPYEDAEIDVVAPPETTPLVLDADGSQRAAVQAAVEGKSFSLDGPPGTGKSQTIANIIGGLIHAGKTVLFVSEKAVALDVVRNRLSATGLGSFVFELHGSKASRKEVAMGLGAALDNKPVPPAGMSPVKLDQARQAREALTEYALAANQTRMPLNSSFHTVLGLYEKAGSGFVAPPFGGDPRSTSPIELARIGEVSGRLASHWGLHLKGDRALWYGVKFEGDPRLVLQRMGAILRRLEGEYIETRALSEAFDFEPLGELSKTVAIVDMWHAEPEFHARPWLDTPDLVRLTVAVDEYERAAAALDDAEADARRHLGENWAEIDPLPDHEVPVVAGEVLGLPGFALDASEDSLARSATSLRRCQRHLVDLHASARELALLVGADEPSTEADVSTLLGAVSALLSDPSPQSTWIYDQQSLVRARAAADATRRAEEELAVAELAASKFFTGNVLKADLVFIEALSVSSRGLFKRFGGNHKKLRNELAGISPEKWKAANANLHLARSWVDASSHFDQESRVAAQLLGPISVQDGRIDWESVLERFANADAAMVVAYCNVEATHRVLTSDSARTAATAELERLRLLLQAWRSDHRDWSGNGDQSELFSEIELNISRRNQLLAPLVALVEQQHNYLVADSTLRGHLEAAGSRVGAQRALAVARVARGRLADIVELDLVAAEMSTTSASLVRRKLDWVQAMLRAAGRIDTPAPALSALQIEGLRNSRPLPGVAVLVSEFDDLAREFLGWFVPTRIRDLEAELSDYDDVCALIDDLSAGVEGARDAIALRRTLDVVSELGLGAAVSHAQREGFPEESIESFLVSTVYRSWIDAQIEDDPRLAGIDIDDRDQLVQRFRELDAQLSGSAIAAIVEAGLSRRPRTAVGQAAVIRREAEKRRRHVPVRDLIGDARDVILAVHPCFMMSPLAVSQYLPATQLFDVVIFDEASQVMPADAINCVYRGAALIAAGDQKQLPPTSFFAAAVDELDEEEEDLATDFESILDLMKSTGAFTPLSLRWHYRSRHEHLIAYSNSSFYDSRLVTFPGAIEQSEDTGVKFIKVDGVYRRSAGSDNPIEAKAVAQRVLHHFTTRPEKTLGVVAFSANQRDAIEAALELARAARPDLDGYFGDDRVAGFFVKSLESVQGDERDVMIFSIGYGPDEHGKVYKQFGPVTRSGGERRLNVAITRAKELVEVVSSMTAADIGEVASAGSRHLRRYLDFAERGEVALQLELGPAGLDTESPFEDAVISYVRSLGFDVQPQVGVSGYRIDMGVNHPNQPGAFMLGIECDGAAYHSSKVARDRDRIRHEILEGLGWTLHHIWGTAWYRHPEREKETLRQLLESLALQPVTGRVAGGRARARPEVVVDVEPETLELAPAWSQDYTVTTLSRIPSYLDLADEYSAGALVPFVEAVVAVEGPVHVDIVAQRLREHSMYDRFGARIRRTLVNGIAQSRVDKRGGFLWPKTDRDLVVRRGTEEFTRSVQHVPNAELSKAILLLIGDSVSITRVALVPQVAAVFGWRRTGADIRDRVEECVEDLLGDGDLVDTGAGLKLVSA